MVGMATSSRSGTESEEHEKLCLRWQRVNQGSRTCARGGSRRKKGTRQTRAVCVDTAIGSALKVLSEIATGERERKVVALVDVRRAYQGVNISWQPCMEMTSQFGGKRPAVELFIQNDIKKLRDQETGDR